MPKKGFGKHECFFRGVPLGKAACLGLESGDPDIKFYDTQPLINFRSDFINRLTEEPLVPSPGKIVPPLGIQVPDKKRLGRHPEDFHQVINIIIKRILKKLYFENDSLKLFLYLSKVREEGTDSNELDIKSAPFKKMLLISNSMKIYKYKKIRKDSFSQQFNEFLAKKVMDIRKNKLKYRWICKISSVIKMKTHLFQLFDEYEMKKLSMEKAWLIHENIVTGRTRWAATFLSNILNHFELLDDNTPAPSPTKLYWELSKAVTHLRNQELLTSGPEIKNDKAKLKSWKLVTDRLVAFRENMREGSVTHFEKLYTYFHNTDLKRKILSLDYEHVAPYLQLLKKEVEDFQEREKDMKDLQKLTTAAVEAVPRYPPSKLLK